MTSLSPLSVANLLFAVTALSLWRATLSDVPCQYPCYPPPPGSTGTSTTPPSGVTGYPPPSGGVYPAPTGYYPYNPPPYGGFSGVPPPPDHILPYFPFYYTRPVHGSPDDQSYSSAATRSGGVSLACLVSVMFVVLVNFCRFD